MRIFCLLSSFAWVGWLLIPNLEKVNFKLYKRKFYVHEKYFFTALFGLLLMIVIEATIDKAWIWCQ